MTEEIRPTKKFKMRENKKYPYKKTRKDIHTELKGGLKNEKS